MSSRPPRRELTTVASDPTVVTRRSPKPPTRVYTRGRRGNVTTHNPNTPPRSLSRSSSQRARSQSREPREPAATGRRIHSLSPRRTRSERISPSRTRRTSHTEETIRATHSSSSRRSSSSNEWAAKQQEEARQIKKTIRKIVDDLNRAQGAQRRVAVITNACETFDHQQEALHDAELRLGAAQALSQWLVAPTNDDELRMVCSALEMVFRGTSGAVLGAYEKIGPSLPLALLRVLARCDHGGIPNTSIISLNILRVLLYLSRCPSIRPALGHAQGIMSALVNTRQNCSINFRTVRIRTVANLANCDQNKTIMFRHVKLLESVLRTANYDDVDHIRHHAALALTEMASFPSNQRDMAANDTLVGILIKMMLTEESLATRETVITAIQHLAYEKENRLKLVTFKNGILLESIKTALTTQDTNPKARRRAASALINLAGAGTCSVIGNHPGLLNTLAVIGNKESESPDVKERTLVALTKLATNTDRSMESHSTVLDALVMASMSKVKSNVAAVLRVKAREPENRELLARHPGILDTLTDICNAEKSSISDRDNAVRALMHLVNEDTNRKLMCTKTILNTLVAMSLLEEEHLEETRKCALQTLKRLATEISNRQFMARHPGLIVAVSKAVEWETQLELDGVKSEQGFLAKALLLTLLVAL